jgi:excinuclease UvrABC ATPase subunit
MVQWCTFAHAAKKCDYEWKRSAWNVTELDCSDFAGRAEFKVRCHVLEGFVVHCQDFSGFFKIAV